MECKEYVDVCYGMVFGSVVLIGVKGRGGRCKGIVGGMG